MSAVLEDPVQRQTIHDAMFEAQKLALAPFAFQCARIMRDQGLLGALYQARRDGLSTATLMEKTGLSEYAVETLCEGGLAFGLCTQDEDEKWIITRTGICIERDPLTRVNMDFTQDVCYEGLFKLEDALLTGKPSGLPYLGDWPDIYQGLSKLPPKAKQSWLAFDHFFSDGAFQQAHTILLDHHRPKRFLDVGGNTGRNSIALCGRDPDVQITIADLPGQCAMAVENLANHGVGDRVKTFPIQLLDPENELPGGQDVVWMSQFLTCFSKIEIVSILERARRALNPGGTVWILDTYWDETENELAAYCLQATSLYFTAMANGNSRMYSFRDTNRLIERAGLHVVQKYDHLGTAHTLLRCEVKPS